MKTYRLAWGNHRLVLGKRTCIMGIVNVTPDSFSDGGKFFSRDDAIAQGQKLFEEGADILDIGGESTRPFSDAVSAEEEIRRVIPVIENLAERISIPISIDTTKSDVARRAIQAGASMINDVSALRLDHGIADVAAEYDIPVILMHMLGTPKTMQTHPVYDDLIKEIKEFLKNAVDYAESKGISKSKIIIDPGIGFGKTVEHNLLLIKHLHEFKTLDVPIMIGPSRKAFIRNILKHKTVKDINPDLAVVETGTQASVAAAVLNGAHMVRVHDVANTRATIKIINAIKNVPYNS
ncbi:MAG: dihydropteroate synthase [Deltaproteobacteria bacterium]|nr:dihydropteroate synthase [Deltaproteobacteria bacterium]MBW1957390.1 dihydropteroate synthase [Deltaproteobacteria bacterium]MBW2012791.1 dihydropteroate synthase [Deltaproteobacteria bacterium]MBW2088270.1 dihydropteroate synthase [Deltaproteobacteria bacterium]MBW2319428.1 dihydropteroate synthase [Deltaproteobacteria bacterium]